MMDEILITIPSAAEGRTLLDYLHSRGISLSADCGGRGVCGKCTVKLISGIFGTLGSPETPLLPDADGKLLSCCAVCSGQESVVAIAPAHGGGLMCGLTDSEPKQTIRLAGIALDIGTTTLAAALVDLSDGSVAATCSRLNPQRSFGADVMSRIGASEAHLEALHQSLIDAIAGMVRELTADLGEYVPECMTVAGNPTMLHLFCGISPVSMGVYPFTPVFTESKVLEGSALSIDVKRIWVLPSASAFIGSDCIAGVLVTDMMQSKAPALLLDIGTNCEMILWEGKARGGRLWAASAAAGPALEGAGISCGVGGIGGAICKVAFDSTGRVDYRTVGGQPSIGICGSGLIDLISELLRTERLDETGYLENAPFVLCQSKERMIALTQEDVRAFQLAKGALRAGMEALVRDQGMQLSELGQLYVAGGLGYYMNRNSAERVGILPNELSGKIKAIGNSALEGAVFVLLHPERKKDLEQIARACRTIELNRSALFNEEFIEQMLFPEE